MYKESVYWDARYEREVPAAEGHEWFGHYSDFAHLVRRQLRPGQRGLVLGCGTSSLSADLYEEGVRPIVSIDYSAICIKEMMERTAGIPEMSWMAMDARHLQFPNESFDLVIEKGTLDSMMVDEKDSWNISPETVHLVDDVLSEVSRVLTSSGCFISVTFSPPHFRTKHYAQPKYGWSVSCDTYGRDFHYFLYIMLKGGKLTPYDIERGQSLYKPCVIPDTMPTLSANEDEDFLGNIQL